MKSVKKRLFDEKYEKIISSIKKNGFGNTALQFSISETASLGGKLDWIKENSLNESIKKILNKKKLMNLLIQ